MKTNIFINKSDLHAVIRGEKYFIREKRKHARRFAAMYVKCYSAARQLSDNCLLVNIGRGGLAVESKIKFPVNEKIMVGLAAPNNKEFYILMKVIHAFAGSYGFTHGVQYIDPDKKALDALNNYLLRHFNLY